MGSGTMDCSDTNLWSMQEDGTVLHASGIRFWFNGSRWDVTDTSSEIVISHLITARCLDEAYARHIATVLVQRTRLQNSLTGFVKSHHAHEFDILAEDYLGIMSDELSLICHTKRPLMSQDHPETELLRQVLAIYDQKYVAGYLGRITPGAWCRETINRWLNGRASPRLSHSEFHALEKLLPPPPKNHPKYDFDFIDLFAGIGGLRLGFEQAGGRCVLTSEWNPYAVRTYNANHYSDPNHHVFNDDIRKLTLSDKEDISETEAYKHIDKVVPDHHVLVAGFPCQPFSIAGVSKKNALGNKHGFECKTQGTLFFDVARIIAAKRPAAFLLENVKNLKSHDKGKTFKVIMETLDELGYWVSDADHIANNDPKIIDGQHFVPQHRERIVLVGFRKDLDVHSGFSLSDIRKHFPKTRPALSDLLDKSVDDKYILTPKLWEYLFNYAIKHKAKGNGFGYGLVTGSHVTRTLSARYHKDGSEILIDRGFDPEKDPFGPENLANRPRRLTPRECARLMGYDAPGQSDFRIPVSDTQAYRQFGNSVVVPVFVAVAKMMKSRIMAAKMHPNFQYGQKRAA